MPELEITAMTFGPCGVGHLGGKTVMVPHSVPGDRLEVEIRSERRDYAVARVTRVVAGSRDRRVAPCPFLPRCGGCDWQQLRYPAQARLKASLVAARLCAAFKFELDPAAFMEPAPAEFGYRSRIRLVAGRRGRLGFRAAGTNAVVEIDHCMVADPILHLPHGMAAALGRNLQEIEVARSDGSQVLVAYLRKPPSRRDVERAQRVLAGDQSVCGVVLRAGPVREVLGNPLLSFEVEPGLSLEVDADLFSQVNHAQNRKLVAAVMEMAAVSSGLRLLDLFCGAGNFSIPAAVRGAAVTGVDTAELLVAAATRNAARLSLTAARFIAMRAADMTRFLARAHYRPQAVILDPPRSGAFDLMKSIINLYPPRIVYVSCDVATLIRDLRIPLQSGYSLSGLKAFDFFPNTHHLEIAAQLVLT